MTLSQFVLLNFTMLLALLCQNLCYNYEKKTVLYLASMANPIQIITDKRKKTMKIFKANMKVAHSKISLGNHICA